MKDFRSLKVWEKAHALVLNTYRITKEFPREELYGLTSQIRRSCSSVPTNIAEACGRSGNAEFHRFLQIAMGSASELEYQYLLSRDLHYIDESNYLALNTSVTEVKRMLASLLSRVEAERHNG